MASDGIHTWGFDAELGPDVLALTVRLLGRVSVRAPFGADRALVGDHVARHLTGDPTAALWRCTTAGCERLA